MSSIMPKNPNHKLPPRYERYRELLDIVIQPDNLPVDIECKDNKDAKRLREELYYMLRRMERYFNNELGIRVTRPVISAHGKKLIFEKRKVYVPVPFKIRRRELIVKEENNE